MSVPVPTFTNWPPVAMVPMAQVTLAVQSSMAPLYSVLKLLAPTVSCV
jgi:hypothetical protein